MNECLNKYILSVKIMSLSTQWAWMSSSTSQMYHQLSFMRSISAVTNESQYYLQALDRQFYFTSIVYGCPLVNNSSHTFRGII